jgi:hypothetical protein
MLVARKQSNHQTWLSTASTAHENDLEFQQIEELIKEQTEALYLLDESIITSIDKSNSLIQDNDNPQSHDNDDVFQQHPATDQSISELFQDGDLLEDETPTQPTRLMKHLFPSKQHIPKKVDPRDVELTELRLEIGRRDESIALLSSRNTVCRFSLIRRN